MKTITSKEYRKLIGKKNKFHAVRCEADGIKFDSMMERDCYLCLKEDVDIEHIDCHVPVTLPGGLRLNIDFIVWNRNHGVKAVEVKGKPMPEFKRMRKLFDEFHPLAPMEVWTRKGKKWSQI